MLFSTENKASQFYLRDSRIQVIPNRKLQKTSSLCIQREQRFEQKLRQQRGATTQRIYSTTCYTIAVVLIKNIIHEQIQFEWHQQKTVHPEIVKYNRTKINFNKETTFLSNRSPLICCIYRLNQSNSQQDKYNRAKVREAIDIQEHSEHSYIRDTRTATTRIITKQARHKNKVLLDYGLIVLFRESECWFVKTYVNQTPNTSDMKPVTWPRSRSTMTM